MGADRTRTLGDVHLVAAVLSAFAFSALRTVGLRFVLRSDPVSNVPPIAVRPSQLREVLGLSRSKAYDLLKTDPTFPKPFTLVPGKRPCVAWDYAELKSWVDQQKARQ